MFFRLPFIFFFLFLYLFCLHFNLSLIFVKIFSLNSIKNITLYQNLPEGIDLCLTCLNGSCPSHSSLHFSQTSHPLVLNFFNSPKPKNQNVDNENNKNVNITKLAIGKEGGAPLEGGGN